MIHQVKDFHNEFAATEGIQHLTHCHSESKKLPTAIPGISLDNLLGEFGIEVGDQPESMTAKILPYPKIEFAHHKEAKVNNMAAWKLSRAQFARYGEFINFSSL